MSNTLGDNSHWYRYENTVIRSIIDCLGLANLKHDPGFCNLAEDAVPAKQLSEELNQNNASPATQEIIILEEGKNSEKKICDYCDKLISCSNPEHYTKWEKLMIYSCMKSYYSVTDKFQQDFVDLVDSVQGHTKRIFAYYLRVDQYGNQHCRFFYSFDSNQRKYIKFITTSSNLGVQFRVEVVLKRNNPRLISISAYSYKAVGQIVTFG